MNNVIQIPVAEQPDGSIAFNPSGVGLASANIQQEPGHPKTAILAFAGSNQAVVQFDDSGRSAINYTILNPGATYQVQQSVVNLINYLTQQPH
jgi:hypothetical protein